MCLSVVASPQKELQQLAASAHDSSLEESLDSFGFPHFRRKHPANTTLQNGKTFTNLQSVPHSVSLFKNDF